MKIIMREYSKLIVASIVAVLLVALLLFINMDGSEGVLNILGGSGIGESAATEDVYNMAMVESANVNNPVIEWKGDSYTVNAASSVSLPDLFLATGGNGETLEIEIVSILYSDEELLFTTDVQGQKTYQQDAEQYVFDTAGVYQLYVYATDQYGNDTTRMCKLVVNQ